MVRDLARAAWHYETSGQVLGPITGAELAGLAASGALAPGDRVSLDAGATWQDYASVADTLAAALAAPPAAAAGEGAPSMPACSLCGRSFDEADLLVFGDDRVCADCKPVFLQRLRGSESTIRHWDFGGFWIRFGARMIDGIILGAANFAIQFGFLSSLGEMNPTEPPGPAFFVMFCGMFLLQMGILAGYNIYFVARHAATPGKMACRLRIVRSDGSPLTWGRATGRFFADLLTGMTIGIGYIIAAFDEEKRALHDHLCDTRVVRTG